MTTLVIPTHAASVDGPAQGQWAYADWEKLPADGNRYEIIDGVLYITTAPSYFHQWIVRRLDRYVGVPAEEQGLAYAAVAPIGVLMPGCDPVQPDFVLVLAEHAAIIRDRRIMGVPDLTVEILSPGSRTYDESVKLNAYAQAGVPEYAVVDPEERVLHLYKLKQPGRFEQPITFSRDDIVTFACVPTIPLEVARLFAGSPDTTL